MSSLEPESDFAAANAELLATPSFSNPHKPLGSAAETAIPASITLSRILVHSSDVKLCLFAMTTSYASPRSYDRHADDIMIKPSRQGPSRRNKHACHRYIRHGGVVYVLVRSLVPPERSWHGHSIRAANCRERSISRHPRPNNPASPVVLKALNPELETSVKTQLGLVSRRSERWSNGAVSQITMIIRKDKPNTPSSSARNTKKHYASSRRSCVRYRNG